MKKKSYTENGEKLCPMCKKTKPPTLDYWHVNYQNPDKLHGLCKICSQKVRDKYRDKDYEHWKKQKRDFYRRKSFELRSEMIAAYGGKCTCCGEAETDFLTLEHVNHDGKEHRKRLGGLGVYRDLKKRGWPKYDYTILCWNCQMATRFGNVCPHKRGG